MKLYLVHCGFYDSELCDGIYESHINFFVAAESFEDARARAKLIPEFKMKRMHIDGLQEIEAVSGMRIDLKKDITLGDSNIINSHKHRDLAVKRISS